MRFAAAQRNFSRSSLAAGSTVKRWGWFAHRSALTAREAPDYSNYLRNIAQKPEISTIYLGKGKSLLPRGALRHRRCCTAE
jgi:hypothetical protein